MPAVGRAEAGDRLDGRGLAGTVGSEDAEDLAFLDGERDAVDGRAVAVALGEVGDFDDVHAPSLAGGRRDHIGRTSRTSTASRSSRGSTERLMRVTDQSGTRPRI